MLAPMLLAGVVWPGGAIQQQFDVPGSTLSHHLSGPVAAGLLSQRREGRTLYCVADYAQLEAVIGWLQVECCKGDGALKFKAEISAVSDVCTATTGLLGVATR